MSTPEDMTASTPYRVLVVDDDPLVARTLARALMARGLSVDVATSCASARRLPGRYDLGIFDIELPDGLGTNLAKDFALGAKVCGTIFYTGASYQPLLRRAWQLGPVVPKQSGTSTLLEAVTTRLSSRRPKFDSGVLTEGDVLDADGFLEAERPTGSF
jgi:DNA-binding response OmpR family regulator